MKKTLIALMALSGLAMGETGTVSTSYKVMNEQGIGCGFTLSPSDFFMTYSDGDETTTGDTLGTSFELGSVQLACTTASGSFASSAKLAIFERPGTDTLGTFVGLSEATAHTTGTTTYNFTDSITLDTSKQYQFFFVADTTEASVFSTTQGNLDTYKNVAVKSCYDKFNVAAKANYNQYLPTGDGILQQNNYSGWDGHYIPVVTLVAATTPEPATATLSLLALAGLAARRRRH